MEGSGGGGRKTGKLFNSHQEWQFEILEKLRREMRETHTFPSGCFLLAAISFTSLGICLQFHRIKQSRCTYWNRNHISEGLTKSNLPKNAVYLRRHLCNVHVSKLDPQKVVVIQQGLLLRAVFRLVSEQNISTSLDYTKALLRRLLSPEFSRYCSFFFLEHSRPQVTMKPKTGGQGPNMSYL